MDLSEANDAQAFMSHAWFGPLKFPKPWETNLQTAQHPDWTSELAIELTLPTEGKEEITTPTGVDFQRDAPAVAAQGPGINGSNFERSSSIKVLNSPAQSVQATSRTLSSSNIFNNTHHDVSPDEPHAHAQPCTKHVPSSAGVSESDPL